MVNNEPIPEPDYAISKSKKIIDQVVFKRDPQDYYVFCFSLWNTGIITIDYPYEVENVKQIEKMLESVPSITDPISFLELLNKYCEDPDNKLIKNSPYKPLLEQLRRRIDFQKRKDELKK